MRTGVDVVGGLFTITFDANGCAPRSTSPALRSAVTAEYIGDDRNALVSVAVTELLSPTPCYCPLVFVGASSLGKTLLACGIARQLRGVHDPQEVLLYSGGDFTRAAANASETNAIADFRRRLREAAALVIDDLDHLAGRTSAQEEIIYAIDSFVAERRPLVFTLSRGPFETKGLLPALASRLSGGLLVPLAPPGPVARNVILRRLVEQYQLPWKEEWMDALVMQESGDEAFSIRNRTRDLLTVPQLQQAVRKLKQISDESGTSEAAGLMSSPWQAVQPELRDISEAVAKYFHQRLDDLHGPARRKELVQARGIAMYLARQLTDKSLGQLGKHFGNRDHTTVMHACRKTEALMHDDAVIRRAIEELAAQLS